MQTNKNFVIIYLENEKGEKFMWTIERVRKELNKLCANDGLDALHIPVQVNGRLTRCMGRVFFTSKSCNPTRFEFARVLLEHGNDEEIEQVIKHEYAHYFLLVTTHEDQGHNQTFKDKCMDIGCYQYNAQNEIAAFKEAYKYDVYCNNCKKIIGQYSRMCKTLKNIDNCYCNICKKSDLKVKQNW